MKRIGGRGRVQRRRHRAGSASAVPSSAPCSEPILAPSRARMSAIGSTEHRHRARLPAAPREKRPVPAPRSRMRDAGSSPIASITSGGYGPRHRRRMPRRPRRRSSRRTDADPRLNDDEGRRPFRVAVYGILHNRWRPRHSRPASAWSSAPPCSCASGARVPRASTTCWRTAARRAARSTTTSRAGASSCCARPPTTRGSTSPGWIERAATDPLELLDALLARLPRAAPPQRLPGGCPVVAVAVEDGDAESACTSRRRGIRALAGAARKRLVAAGRRRRARRRAGRARDRRGRGRAGDGPSPADAGAARQRPQPAARPAARGARRQGGPA